MVFLSYLDATIVPENYHFYSSIIAILVGLVGGTWGTQLKVRKNIISKISNNFSIFFILNISLFALFFSKIIICFFN